MGKLNDEEEIRSLDTDESHLQYADHFIILP